MDAMGQHQHQHQHSVQSVLDQRLQLRTEEEDVLFLRGNTPAVLLFPWLQPLRRSSVVLESAAGQ